MVEDGLASNGPHVRLLKELGMSFVLGAKPGDHKALFAWVDELESAPPAPGVEAGRGALGDGGRGRRGARLPVVERGAAERRRTRIWK